MITCHPHMVADATPALLHGRTVYVAGPMRGRDQRNFPAFDAAADWLRGIGATPINPADMDRHHGISANEPDPDQHIRQCLHRDLTAIIEQADAVIVLDGWDLSRGARTEVALALAIGLPVYRPGFRRSAG